jgi:hypothetical protein
MDAFPRRLQIGGEEALRQTVELTLKEGNVKFDVVKNVTGKLPPVGVRVPGFDVSRGGLQFKGMVKGKSQWLKEPGAIRVVLKLRHLHAEMEQAISPASDSGERVTVGFAALGTTNLTHNDPLS